MPASDNSTDAAILRLVFIQACRSPWHLVSMSIYWLVHPSMENGFNLVGNSELGCGSTSGNGVKHFIYALANPTSPMKCNKLTAGWDGGRVSVVGSADTQATAGKCPPE
ncbi:hypothetical protein AB1N83_011837, partial [Pleurotus pulmonarius]